MEESGSFHKEVGEDEVEEIVHFVEGYQVLEVVVVLPQFGVDYSLVELLRGNLPLKHTFQAIH